VTGNEVKFTAEVADQTITWVGKRVQ